MADGATGLPNLKISFDNNEDRSKDISLIVYDDVPETFPYKCTCQRDPCECGCADINEDDIRLLFDSLGIRSRDNALSEGFRLNAIHVWGTADLSTDDLLGYFGEYNPSTIEWIDDDTCNVIFEKESSAFRAIFYLSEAQTTEEICIISSSSDEEYEHDYTDRAIEKILSLAGEIPIVDYDEAENEMMDETQSHHKDKKMVKKGVLPTGKWRQAVGTPEKASLLYLRYAKASDRKQKNGAERKSKYYQRYGNPNFGGVPGIITDSFRRRMLQKRRTSPNNENTRDVQVDGRTAISYGELYDSDTEKGEISDEGNDAVGNSSSAPRGMRMIADDEEEKRTKSHSSVHSRLGGRHRLLGRLKPSDNSVHSRVGSDEDFDSDLHRSSIRKPYPRSRDRSPLVDSDSEFDSSRSWKQERHSLQKSSSGERNRKKRKGRVEPNYSRIADRLGPMDEDKNVGSDFMRRRMDFYCHDDRSAPRTDKRSRLRIEDRWTNDKFYDF